jgi:hypothetical protein
VRKGASLGKEAVLADSGRAGEKSSFFDHPVSHSAGVLRRSGHRICGRNIIVLSVYAMFTPATDERPDVSKLLIEVDREGVEPTDS